jgi:hypothetical protein
MEFYPKNKYLLVEPVEDAKPENKTSGFILPEDYKKIENHKAVKLLRAAGDSPYRDLGVCLLVVSSNMIEEIKAAGKTIYVVPESAVYGAFYN